VKTGRTWRKKSGKGEEKRGEGTSERKRKNAKRKGLKKELKEEKKEWEVTKKKRFKGAGREESRHIEDGKKRESVGGIKRCNSTKARTGNEKKRLKLAANIEKEKKRKSGVVNERSALGDITIGDQDTDCLVPGAQFEKCRKAERER